MFSANVEKIFDTWLQTKFAQKTEVKNFLLNHERKKVVIENTCYQILRAENYNVNVNANKYKILIETCAEMFAKVALSHIEQKMKSKLQIQLERMEEDRIKDAEEHIKDLEKEALSDSITSFGGI